VYVRSIATWVFLQRFLFIETSENNHQLALDSNSKCLSQVFYKLRCYDDSKNIFHKNWFILKRWHFHLSIIIIKSKNLYTMPLCPPMYSFFKLNIDLNLHTFLNRQ
jgi:hypothetical protein